MKNKEINTTRRILLLLLFTSIYFVSNADIHRSVPEIKINEHSKNIVFSYENKVLAKIDSICFNFQAPDSLYIVREDGKAAVLQLILL